MALITDENDNLVPIERPQPTAAVSEKMSDDEHLLRVMLARHAGGPLLCTDDGEMQCASELPYIDFLRDTPQAIYNKLSERGLRKLHKLKVDIAIAEKSREVPKG